VLENGVVIVLELKGWRGISAAALDQVFAYARDLSSYHASCAGRAVHPILVPADGGAEPKVIDGVLIVGPEGLHRVLARLAGAASGSELTAESFLEPDAYAPLPSIVQAARDLFDRKLLPAIKRARAATEPALKEVTDIAHEAARTRTRRLVLLTGVPGSGKTLVGLQLVHAGWIDDLAVPRQRGRPAAPAVYLSGNGPLVAVLQDALKEAGGGGRVFVPDIKRYVDHCGFGARHIPPEHLIVFDEAQRAHDAARVAHVHRQHVSHSEPAHLIALAERIPDWCVIVALVGTGQAIHVGEEGGLALWREAIEATGGRDRWTVHASAIAEQPFLGASFPTRWHPALNLDTEIRFHLTPKVHEFVDTDSS